MSRRAFSMVEVIIASAILVSVMAAVMEVTVSARSFEASAAAQDDLSADAERCLRSLGEDLTLSGWHIPDKTTSAGLETALEVSGVDSGRLSSDPGTDRTRRYFPYVIGSGNGLTPAGTTISRANPTFFPYAAQHASVVIDTTAVAAELNTNVAPAADVTSLGTNAAAAAAWYGSFTGPSQSLLFLRVFTFDGVSEFDETLPVATRQQMYNQYLQSPGPSLRFGEKDDSDLDDWKTTGHQSTLNILYASSIYETSPGNWSLRSGVDDTEAYGVSLESGFIVTGSDGALRIQPQWESLGLPTHTAPATEDEWREYIYTVVRSPFDSRLGRLVRAHKETLATPLPTVGVEPGQTISTTTLVAGNDALVVDRVLSDNVVRITFDTYRTDRMFNADDGRLDVNQVRVRIYLARPDQIKRTVLTKVAAATFTMRAKNTETQRTDDLTLLGPDRPGFPR